MSHKVHPFAHRLPLIRSWQSRWFISGRSYREALKSDILLREYLEKKLRGKQVAAIEIERGRNEMRLLLKAARPGVLIGRSGEGSAKLKQEILFFLQNKKLTVPKDIRLDIEEVKNAEAQAAVVAQMIAANLEKQLPVKRVMKQAMDKILANRQVKGARLTLSGRLGGAEIARIETLKRGRLPLQTLKADVDFAREKAYLPYGVIGIKVWICRDYVDS